MSEDKKLVIERQRDIIFVSSPEAGGTSEASFVWVEAALRTVDSEQHTHLSV